MDISKHFRLPSEEDIPSKRLSRFSSHAADFVGEYYACLSLPDFDEKGLRKE